MKKLLSFVICFLAVTAAGAQTAEEWIARGDRFDAQLNTQEALAAYLEAEKITPDDPILLIKIATQLGESMVDARTRQQQKASGLQALEYSRRALQLAPSMSDAHLAMAVCYARLIDHVPPKTRVENSRLVKFHSERAIELDPENDLAWHMLGRWHQAMAEVGPMLRGLVKLIYGGLPAASIEDSISCLRKAASLNPHRVAHQIELGRSLALAGKREDALAALERGLTLPNRERDDPGTKARGRETLANLN